jgi:hypothetical protein
VTHRELIREGIQMIYWRGGSLFGQSLFETKNIYLKTIDFGNIISEFREILYSIIFLKKYANLQNLRIQFHYVYKYIKNDL